MDQAVRGERLARYQSARTVPLLVAGFLYLGSFIAFRVDGEPATAALFYTSWVVFMVDYAIQLALAPRKWQFVVGHPLYLLSLVFPPLRVWLLITVSIRFTRDNSHSLRDRVGLASLVVVALIIIFGGLVTLIFEDGQSGANIETYGESLWWASVTLTSVGFGDFVPVTFGGRVTGTFVFSTGVAALAVVTATIVAWFTPRNSTGVRPEAPDASSPPGSGRTTETSSNDSQIDAVLAKLDEISARLVAIELAADKIQGAASPTLSEEHRTVESDEGSATST